MDGDAETRGGTILSDGTAPRPSGKYEDMFCLASVIEWWEGLPPRLRQDIEGSGAEPGCIAKARRLVAHYKKHG